MNVQNVYDLIHTVAPFDTQMDGDNSGLLVGSPAQEISCILFALDVTEQVCLCKEDLDEIEGYGTKVADLIISSTRIARETNRKNGEGESYTLHDLCPVVYLQYPELFTGKRASVYVETRSPLTAGKTVSDIYTLMDHRLKENEVMIMLKADRDRMVKIVKELFRAY